MSTVGFGWDGGLGNAFDVPVLHCPTEQVVQIGNGRCVGQVEIAENLAQQLFAPV